MVKTIAYLQFGAMADVLYSTPILREIRARNPSAHITWFIRDIFRNVVETNPYLDAVKTYILPLVHSNKQENEHIMWAQMKTDAVNGPYDEVIKPQQWPDHDFWRSDDDLLTLMMQNAGLNYITNRHIDLVITDEDRKNVDRRFKDVDWTKVITINHISYAASPVWTIYKYIDLAEELVKQGLTPMFTGSKDEFIPTATSCLDARGTTYREWTECIRRSSLWLGLDSGAKALVASTNTPMIVLHSKDFPLSKTGVKAMELRMDDNVMELVDSRNSISLLAINSVVSLIQKMRK